MSLMSSSGSSKRSTTQIILTAAVAAVAALVMDLADALPCVPGCPLPLAGPSGQAQVSDTGVAEPLALLLLVPLQYCASPLLP